MKPCFHLGHYLYSVRGRCRVGFQYGIGGLLVVFVAIVLLSDTTSTTETTCSTAARADAFVLRSINRRNRPAIGHPLSNRHASGGGGSSSSRMGPGASQAASRESAKPFRCSATTTTTVEDPSTGAFLEEMFRDRGCQGEPGAVQIRVDPATGYRGLYVSSPEIIREGDYIFAVPFSSTWVVEGSGSGSEDEIENNEEELSDAQRGLRFWNWKQSQERQHEEGNGNSDWKSYLDLLPKRNNNKNPDNDNDNDNDMDGEWFDPTPEFWSEEQIAALELPLAIERIRSRRESVAELAANVADVEEDDLRFATWLINSRVVTVVLGGEEEDEEDEFEREQEDAECDNDEYDDDDDCDESFSTTCVLVPLLDMINHSSDSPNAYFSVLGDDGDSDGDSNAEEELFYAAIADRDLHPGEEILISYEQESTLDLLLRYGFLPASESSQPCPADLEVWESIAASLEDDEEEGDADSDSTASGVGWWPDGSRWSTTIGEDEERKDTVVAALSSGVGSNQHKHDLEIELTTLEFRIRMKRTHREWNAATLVSARGM